MDPGWEAGKMAFRRLGEQFRMRGGRWRAVILKEERSIGGTHLLPVRHMEGMEGFLPARDGK